MAVTIDSIRKNRKPQIIPLEKKFQTITLFDDLNENHLIVKAYTIQEALSKSMNMTPNALRVIMIKELPVEVIRGEGSWMTPQLLN